MYKMGALAALVSVVEVLLIFAGLLPPVLSYSPPNILFMLAQFALVAYAGVAFAKQDLKISFITGAFVAFCGIFIIVLASALNYLYIHKTVLGVLVWNREELFVLMVTTILQNMAIGAIVAAIAGWLSMKFAKN